MVKVIGLLSRPCHARAYLVFLGTLLLLERDLVAEREGDALRLRAYADVSDEFAAPTLFHGNVDERVLPED